MSSFTQTAAERRARNAHTLGLFGVLVEPAGPGGYVRTVRKGGATTIVTIGYEKRSPDDLMARLGDAGVDVLVDVRERPTSRRVEYRAGAIRALCLRSGITYQGWSQLGSTAAQRDALHETGDIEGFLRNFRTYATENLMPAIGKLAVVARQHHIALLCYERDHDECHRMVLADLLADQLNATVVAIV